MASYEQIMTMTPESHYAMAMELVAKLHDNKTLILKDIEMLTATAQLHATLAGAAWTRDLLASVGLP